ncbi:Fucose permease [Sanguibacter gelidistatuariae]|uniref:Fucose permease n=1 Tax=Sanguibacter gelidistatuariae TaxID=1814289 RepID=A0A1G6WWB3_9MICO|nr:MFS transporter [Sanguibacter gelidistatuariae]SDD70188.1 Fucose permease [Sanguibacter gelidistatuariae]
MSRPNEATVVSAAARAVYAIFFLAGFNFANWASRIPLVRDLLGYSPAQMGRVVLIAAIGSILALPLSGWIVQRIGARLAIGVFAAINVAGFVIAAWGVTHGAVPLALAGLFLSGVGMGVWDAAMNLEGAAVEQRLGRAIMPRFHASFSFGTMAGAGMGALASWLNVPLDLHVTLAVLVSLALVLVSVRFLLPAAEAPASGAPGVVGHVFDDADPAVGVTPTKHNPFGAWLERRTLLIGLVVLAAALTEGAANDWLSLSVVDGFDGYEDKYAVGAMVLFVFLAAMTGMRLLGTALLDKHGRVFVLRLSAVLALVGLGVFALSPWLPLAVVGVIAWGMGAALGFPVGMSAASDDPARAAGRLSVVSTIGYTAFFAGPPVLGWLADHIGYRHALLTIAVPVLLGLLVSSVAASPEERERRALGRTSLVK